MDLLVDLGQSSSLHLRASGALTFLGLGEFPAGWDDDIAILTIVA